MDSADSPSYQQFVAIDGDRIGETLERLILLEDLNEVRRFSNSVEAAVRSLQAILGIQGF